MGMGKLRLADSSLIYRLREMMENNGWASGEYTVMDAYPTNLDTITKFPTITVQTITGESRPIQLGYKGALSITWALDIFAKTNGQRDDITQLVWDDLLESTMTIYDFNDGFPSILGDYTGIGTLGTVNFEDNINMSIIEPDTFSKTIAEKNHSLIVISGYMSVD